MKQFELASLGNWINGWIQPNGAIYGFHNHSVWGDNPMRWADYTSGHSTFAAPYMAGFALMLNKCHDARGAAMLEKMVLYQANSMREDGEYKHIGFQTGELAKVGLIHNMVPAVSLALAVQHAKEQLSEAARQAAYNSVLRVLSEGSKHYNGGRATINACCNQDYTRIWAKLLMKQVFNCNLFEQEAIEDLTFMVENFHMTGVPDSESDGTIRALVGKEQLMLEPAEYYGLMILPLCLGYRMYKNEKWLDAALRLCRHVVRSSFTDSNSCRRIHRVYYSLEGGGWGRLTQPMQIQGNGMTMLGIKECCCLNADKELESFLNEMNHTMAYYQTKRGFICPATGWSSEADAAPATAWQAHDFLYFAHCENTASKEFWNKMFADVSECSVVLTDNCIWIENGKKWTIQDYFSRSVYQLFGRKDRKEFGRDLCWTGERNVVDSSYQWDFIPAFVLNGNEVVPLRTLQKNVKIYNFSSYIFKD